jgi:hypothetical protein
MKIENLVRSLLALGVLFGWGERDAAESGEIGGVTQALSAEQTRVLGFENVDADWSSTVGALSAATTVSQGSQA